MLIHQKSPQVSRGIIVVPLKTPYLRVLGSYRSCNRTFLDMYQQVTTRGKLDLKLSQITETSINQNFVSINFELSITLIEPHWEDC